MTITLNVTQNIQTEADLLVLALALWYKETIEKENTEEMTVEEANKQVLEIKEVLEDTTKCIAIISTEEIPNTVFPKEYVENYFYKKNVAEWIQAVKTLKLKELQEKRALEDKAIEEGIEAKLNL